MARFRLSIGSFLLLMIALPAWGANILGLFSSHSQSHLILHMSMMRALAEEGHNVTVVSMVKPTVMHKDIHLIVVPVTEEQSRIMEDQLTQIAGQKNSMINTLNRLLNGLSVLIESQAELLSHPSFQRIYETQFDLMFLGYFLNDFQLGVAAKLKVPVIVAWVQASMSVVDKFVGNPAEISYVPNMGSPVARGEIMNVGQRIKNFLTDLVTRVMTIIFEYRSEKYYQQLFGSEANLPTRSQMVRNISMVFTNSHSISEGAIRPLVPGSVEIGGIQIKDKPDPLPKDIAEFLDTAENGAILLSLGSNIKSTSIKPEIVRSIFNVLSGLKQRVIWKWEDPNNTPGKSANILYKKWLPQDDILVHPRIKLFITHAGKGGTTEAQYHGVPMVALPIFGDQHGNAGIMEKAGYGLALELLNLTEEKLKSSIQEVLNNEKYTLAIKRFSQLYRDRPLSPKQTVVYWTNYVLRHKGAAHLQSPAVHMNTLTYHNLDVYALLLIALLITLFTFWQLFKFIWRQLRAKLSKTNKKSKQK